MEYAWIGYVVLGIAIGFGWGVLAQMAASEYVRKQAMKGRLIIDAPISPYQEQMILEQIRKMGTITEYPAAAEPQKDGK